MRQRTQRRTDAEYVCQNCGKHFHPLYDSLRLYCSTACAGEARQRGLRARVAEIAAETEAWKALEAEEDAEFWRELEEFEPLPSLHPDEEGEDA